MKFTINKRLAALVLATAVATSQFQTVAYATTNLRSNTYETQKNSVTEYYENDCSKNEQLPKEVGGVVKKEDFSIENDMIKLDTHFDGTYDWGNNLHELSFFTSYEGTVEAGSVVSFDIILPEDKANFAGEIKFKGAVKDSSWSWNEGGLGVINADNFEKIDGGYVKATATATIESELNGLNVVVLQIIGAGISELDSIYIDNIKVNKEAQQEKANYYKNEFSSEKQLPNEFSGTVVEGDYSIDNDMMKLNTHFDGTYDWNGNMHELGFFANYEGTVKAGSVVSFDIVLPEDKANFAGEIKFKGAVKDGDWSWNEGVLGVITADNFEKIDGGYVKATATATIESELNGLKAVVLQIIGAGISELDYIYIDNLSVDEGDAIKEEPSIPTEDKEHYLNQFDSDDSMPKEVNGAISLDDVSIENEMLSIESKFDGSDDWDKNKHELNFYYDYSEKIGAGSKVYVDLLIPTSEKDFGGEIKFKAALKDSSWGYKGGALTSITSSDFEDLDNGYSKITLESTVSDSVDGLKAIVLELSAYECTYNGKLFMDNLRVFEKGNSGSEVLPEVETVSWDFSDGTTQGWGFEGVWAHTGKPEVSFEPTIGDGSLKLSLDFTNDTDASWSEVKLKNAFAEDMNINGYNMLTYDFIYNPANMTIGSFKTKLYSDGAIDTYTDIKLEELEDLDGGLKKAKATIKFPSVNKDISDLILAVIGVNTNYKGDIYLDNIQLSQEEVKNVYVDITEEVKPQTAIDVNSLDVRKDAISFVDNNIMPEAASLYSYLMGVGKSDKVVYGHQNDTHKFIGRVNQISDSADITGSISGMVGLDTLSFTGDEGDGVDFASQLSIDAAKDGGIITLSSHMPNFAQVAAKGKDADGNYDYSGYTCPDTSGNIVSRIMPGGDLNEVFTGYLDMIAEYGLNLQDAGVPVLFRPFHENNGSWFWWGKAFCDTEAYKNLYKYTVEYLRDDKGVNNFIYVYSPNGPFDSEEQYLDRYPGDDFVDVIAFDMYHDDPTATDNWMSSFKETIELVQGIADKKGKLSIVAETGLRAQYSVNPDEYYAGLAPEGNVRKDWFNEVLNVVSESNMASFMVWANFSEPGNFSTPFRATETTGHEMINEFIDFYNSDKSVFASEIVDTDKVDVDVDDTVKEYGYFLNPVSGSRILEAADILASVKAEGDVEFKLNDANGKTLVTIDATKNQDGLYGGRITEDDLAKMGETVGTIDLVVGGKVLSTVNIFFNIAEVEKGKELVDDFEDYMGESSLLLNSWATNVGPGCSINPELTSEEGTFNSGKYGLAFNYKISDTKVNEGWAGMTISKNVDWSEYDALQLWIKPDGKAQKLVIQITAGGEDFEYISPELAGTTEGRLITIPFSEFVGKKNGEFNPAYVTSVGLWCNTIPEEGQEGSWTVESTMYFDDIKAVDTTKLPEEDGDDDDDNNGGVVVNPGTGSGNGTDSGDTNGGSTELPETGGINSALVSLFGIAAIGAGALALKKKEDEE